MEEKENGPGNGNEITGLTRILIFLTKYIIAFTVALYVWEVTSASELSWSIRVIYSLVMALAVYVIASGLKGESDNLHQDPSRRLTPFLSRVGFIGHS